MSRTVNAIAPARMGTSFRWLLASSWLSNLGDGMALAAGPLLLASLTDDPLLISMAVLAQRMPWMIFGLYAGVLADRLDRRRLVAVVDMIRAVVIAGLAVSILTEMASVWIVLASLFVLGVAETFADITTGTLLPMIVDHHDLGIANARTNVGFQTLNQLADPPLGGLLFGVGMALPFVGQAVLVVAAVQCVLRISTTHEPDEGDIAKRSTRSEIVEAARWLWHHGPMRTLTLTVVLFNVTFGAAWAVLVLYSLDRLGMGEVGFGLLAASTAVGAILGGVVYGPVERAIGPANIMRIGLLIETATHLTLALTTSPIVALATMFVFGVHTGMWGITIHTTRQRQVPIKMQGRVSSVYMLGMQGGLVVGTPIGGALAAWWGLAAPFWFAFVGSVLILVWIWRQLAAIATTRAEAVEPALP